MIVFLLTLAAVCGLLLYWLAGLPGLALAGAVGAAYAVHRREAWRLEGLPVKPALLYGGALFASTLFSVDAWRSLPAALWQVALGLLAVVAATHARTDEWRRYLLRAAAIASLVVIAPNAAAWMEAGRPLLWRVTWDHNNGIALFNVIFILALATGELKRAAWWPWLGAFAWLTWYSGSRGAAVGLVFSLVVWCLVTRFRVFWPLSLAPLGALAAIFDGGRLTSLSDRDQYWGVATQMANLRKLTGTGSDTFNLFYNAAYPDRVSYNFNHAHSLIFNTLAEGGTIAVFGLVLLYGWLLAHLFVRRANVWASGALAMLVGLFVHSLVDVPTSSAYVATAAVMLTAVGLTAE